MSMVKPKVRADQIKHALSKRHTEDLFLTEVKNGSTWTNNKLLKIDALAIKKSWSKPCITGYEVKVDRQDFLRDEKWPGYREQCHRLYFACPTGLIKPEELPDDIGLIYYSPDTGGLFTKKKALFRDIEIKWEMLYYILLSRIDSDRHPFFSDQREAFQAYVLDKEDRRDLAWKVGSKLVSDLSELGKSLKSKESEILVLQKELKKFEEIKNLMQKFGLNNWNWRDELISRLQGGIGDQMKYSIKRLYENAKELNNLLIKQNEIRTEDQCTSV